MTDNYFGRERNEAMPKTGARVECFVLDKDGFHRVGDGTFLGYVKVWIAMLPGGGIHSQENPENPPDQELKAEMESMGVKFSYEDNPKIQLDDGTIVYGCQVWWKEIVVSPFRQIIVPEDYSGKL